MKPSTACTINRTHSVSQQLSSGIDRFNDKVFQSIYSRNLVYNTCWEDPAVDRQALNIQPHDTLLVITSAGCNVLDYALTNPAHVYAVDMNPRQNALLELKLASIKTLEHDDFFQLFGTGRHQWFTQIYFDCLRAELGDYARHYWDNHLDWFSEKTGGLYFHGLSGIAARSFHYYLRISPKLRSGIDHLLATESIESQREVFQSLIQPHMWDRKMNWLLSRQLTMNLLGVPHPQRKEVERQHLAGVSGFVREAIEYVFQMIPLTINYFWRVYMTGSYTRTCCPEYLKTDNFYRLKSGLLNRISQHTCSVTDFLESTNQPISRFVLLDHMDWMSSYRPRALLEEWQAIFNRAAEDTRIIFRSAHRQPAYLDDLVLPAIPGPQRVIDRLCFYPELASDLQQQDRVHTYAGFHIADVCH